MLAKLPPSPATTTATNAYRRCVLSVFIEIANYLEIQINVIRHDVGQFEM